MRKVAVLVAVVGGLIFVPSASAAIPSALGVTCDVQGDGVRYCSNGPNPRSTSPTWDGVPIDVNIAFPADPAPAADGDYPLMMMFHGYGGSKLNLNAMRRWLDQGYATFSLTDRGFGQSCGTPASRAAAGAACTTGYNHLQDTRYEVRDAQFLAARLVGEGLVDADRIGAIGGSYGGGKSMALGALKNRIMLPNSTYAPWEVEGGPDDGDTITLAAAAPEIPWTDLAYSLVPNGSTLDYVTNNFYSGRVGVQKRSFVDQLFLSGCNANTFCSTTDPDANLPAWKARLDQGEPYEGDPLVADILDETKTHHSSYYIDSTVPPAPMLISNGWTDDLFPADEALRFYNRTRAQYPNNPISLMFLDYGHPRGQNKAADLAKLALREHDWMARYVLGRGGPTPFQGVEAITQTCPGAAPSGGPYFAPNWEAIHPGEVRIADTGTQTILPGAGDQGISGTFNPINIFTGGACATAPGADQPGVASYRVQAAPAGGYTLIGSPTVIADITSPGENSQIAARLLDVRPDGQETLVARGLWRPQVSSSPVSQVFQLHPNGWTFEEGHIAKLELLPNDSPYGQTSNGQQNVEIRNLELRLPVVDEPGAAGGLVQTPLPKFFPGDSRPQPIPATGRAKLGKGKLTVTGKRIRLRVTCPASVAACPSGKVTVQGAPKKGKQGRFVIARGTFAATGGQTKTLNLKLTKQARNYFSERKTLRARVTISNAGTPGTLKQIRGAKKQKALKTK